MLNDLALARVIGIWCMSVMTIGAWAIVSGAALSIVNGELLFAACLLPPLVVVTAWRHRTPVAVTAAALLGAIALPSARAQSPSHYRDTQFGGVRQS